MIVVLPVFDLVWVHKEIELQIQPWKDSLGREAFFVLAYVDTAPSSQQPFSESQPFL